MIEDNTTILVMVDDLKNNFSFSICCCSLDDFLCVAERFPLSSYHFTIEED